MPVYSNSKLATYENCPRKYKLQYIDRIELPEARDGIEAFLGSRVHETLEKLHKELILTKTQQPGGTARFLSGRSGTGTGTKTCASSRRGTRRRTITTPAGKR